MIIQYKNITHTRRTHNSLVLYTHIDSNLELISYVYHGNTRSILLQTEKSNINTFILY